MSTPLRARYAGRRPWNDLESLGSDSAPAHFAQPVLALRDANQRCLDCRELVHDLIVNGDIRESLDGDARALAHTFAERDPPARHVRAGAKRSRTMFELVPHGFEGCDEFVGARRFGVRLWSWRHRHAVDCTTGTGSWYLHGPIAAGRWSLSAHCEREGYSTDGGFRPLIHA